MGTLMLPGLRTPVPKDEPTFTLRAKDTLAPLFVRLWVDICSGNIVEATATFAEIADTGRDYQKVPRDMGKLDSAENVALAMNEWRRINCA